MRKPKRTEPGSYTELRMWSESLADAQDARIAFENKKRSGTVDAVAFDVAVQHYKEAEKYLREQMVACYRNTAPASVLKWQEASAGIGDSTLARLLGITGDPLMAYPKHWEGTGSARDGGTGRHLVEDPPHERTIGQLWQYCGVGAPKNRDVKGNAEALMANGSPDAKKLVFLLASAQVKSNAKDGTAYRHVYDAVKAKYSQKVHSYPCTGGYSGPLYVKCKTHPVDVGTETGQELFTSDVEGAEFMHPDELNRKMMTKLGYAQAGDPYQKSHVNAIALRLTGKEILRDLWLAAAGELDPAPSASGRPRARE